MHPRDALPLISFSMTENEGGLFLGHISRFAADEILTLSISQQHHHFTAGLKSTHNSC
jgi:hypothetical protein